ncbi:MAG: BrnA antitoxin family protein [Micropepsaceae bacterium]
MQRKSGKRITDPDNPEWTAAAFRRARPAREVVPHIVEAYLRQRGRPTQGEAAKVQVTLRLDPAIIAHFKARGAGWQTRINDELMKVIGGKLAGKKKAPR